MSDELKPCPFCGGGAWVQDSPTAGSNFVFYVSCMSCSSAVCFHVTEAEAIAAWNQRADIPVGVAEFGEQLIELERLREAADYACELLENQGPCDDADDDESSSCDSPICSYCNLNRILSAGNGQEMWRRK